jgi:hypothetical protein
MKRDSEQKNCTTVSRRLSTLVHPARLTLEFERCPIPISIEILTNHIEFCGFPQPLRVISEIYPQLRHDLSLRHHFQLNVHNNRYAVRRHLMGETKSVKSNTHTRSAIRWKCFLFGPRHAIDFYC